jgi:uncharacterized hydrophobic protein (TIGR00271 family)
MVNIKRLLINIFDFLNLEPDVDDFDKIHESVQKDIIFKGTNLWILIFAIIVASVGLNMNSTAVIIGAMLISPLMGPINGMGYSIATYNFPLFRKALKNFLFAVVASLAASTLYFSITPISTAHSELLARTSPTIYDVLIALFGGLAGILAISSKLKGNVIPGVAIATALMPPLCTAGFGIATGQFEFFFGAMYLFTINTVFIALSSVLISQILKFPIRTLVDEKRKKTINRYISLVIALVLIPSIFFGYRLVQQERFVENANLYVNNVSIFEGSYLLRHEIIPETKTIRLVYGGARFTEEQSDRIRRKKLDFNLDNAILDVSHGLTFDHIATRATELENLRMELNRLNLALREKENIIRELESAKMVGEGLFNEVSILFPQVSSLSHYESFVFDKGSQAPELFHHVVVELSNAGRNFYDIDKQRIEAWLKHRLRSDRLRIFYVNIQEPER